MRSTPVLVLYGSAFLATVVAALVLAPAVGRRLGARDGIAALLVFGFGLIVTVTLLPDGDALRGLPSSGVCDVSRVGLIPLRELTRVNEASLNVLLFVPLGLAVAMLPRTRGAALVALGAVALPFVVEGLQLVVTVLGRGCQTADVFDNLLGLAVGFALGTLGRAIVPGLGSTRDA
jgi:hypothetical protein